MTTTMLLTTASRLKLLLLLLPLLLLLVVGSLVAFIVIGYRSPTLLRIVAMAIMLLVPLTSPLLLTMVTPLLSMSYLGAMLLVLFIMQVLSPSVLLTFKRVGRPGVLSPGLQVATRATKVPLFPLSSSPLSTAVAFGPIVKSRILLLIPITLSLEECKLAIPQFM